MPPTTLRELVDIVKRVFSQNLELLEELRRSTEARQGQAAANTRVAIAVESLQLVVPALNKLDDMVRDGERREERIEKMVGEIRESTGRVVGTVQGATAKTAAISSSLRPPEGSQTGWALSWWGRRTRFDKVVFLFTLIVIGFILFILGHMNGRKAHLEQQLLDTAPHIQPNH